MENLSIYNKVRVVPDTAKKSIGAGRLKGMTDISPMWRIKIMTETFGVCGIGWYYTIEKQWLEEGSEGAIKCFCNINLYVKVGNEWSMAIPGTGGSDFIAKESRGLYTSDECYKMALTDALSVSMKALGIGADVYFEKDRTKYNNTDTNGSQETKKQLSDAQVNRLIAIANSVGHDITSVKKTIMKKYNKTNIADLTKTQYDECCAGFESLKKE